MSDKPRSERIGTGMGAWSKGLESSAPDLARQLNRPREAGWQALEELDLPRYKRVVVSASEFLDHPQATVAEIPSKRLFVFLRPKEGLPVRETKLTIKEAVKFVRKTTGKHPEHWKANIVKTRLSTLGSIFG